MRASSSSFWGVGGGVGGHVRDDTIIFCNGMNKIFCIL